MTGVKLKSFKELAAPIIHKAHAGERLAEPWLLAFHQVLDDTLDAQRLTANSLGIREMINLIFDEKDEFKARVGRRA